MNSLPALATTARSLMRQPATSILIVSMLAVGIAGTSAMFNLVHSLVLAPLAFEDAERLVYLDETAPRWDLEYVGIDYADFDAWRSSNRTFESMALSRSTSFNLVSSGSAERIDGGQVTYDLLAVLRLAPHLGRDFSADEGTPGGDKVAMMTYDLWQKRFGGNPGILGQTLKLNGTLHKVIGVLPKGLRYPADAELWVPLTLDPTEVGSYQYQGIGRLLPGVTIARAREDLNATTAALVEAHPWKADATALVEPLREHYTRGSRTIAWVLLASVGLVLIIACANVASLMLVRSSSRHRELSVRMALGAGRRRIVAQLLGESLLLALAGGAIGLGLGHLALRSFGTLAAGQLPFWVDLAPNAQASGLCVAAAVATALAFGLVPALQTVRLDIRSSLSSGDSRSIAGRDQRRLLSSIVIAEMALAQMLLVGAALLALSQRTILDVEPGYRTADTLNFSLYLPTQSYADDATRATFFTTLTERLATLPGVRGAAAVTAAPLRGDSTSFFVAEGRPQDPDAKQPAIITRKATAGYLETMGITLLKGRSLQGGSGEENLEAVVNETMARLFWPDSEAIGRRIRVNYEGFPWLTVVGVAADVRQYGPDEPLRPGLYLPLGYDRTGPTITIALHTTVEPRSLLPTVRQVVAKADPELPLFNIATGEEDLHQALAMRRLTAWLFTLFAVVALLLAAGGAYGVLSFSVGQRRREIGLRIALGARTGQVLVDVLRRGLGLAGTGAALGLVGAAAVSNTLAALLFEVNARDPLVFASVLGILGAVALVATAVPALRAARTDAMVVLREE